MGARPIDLYGPQACRVLTQYSLPKVEESPLSSNQLHQSTTLKNDRSSECHAMENHGTTIRVYVEDSTRKQS
jgi:hypothetical protein